MSFLLQFVLVPGGAGGVPVFPDAAEFLSQRLRVEAARHGGRVDAAGSTSGLPDEGHAPFVERASFPTADGALAAALDVARAIQSPARQPRVPMPFRAALDRDALPDDPDLSDERFAACAALCAAGHTGQVLATEAFAEGVTAAMAPAVLEPLDAARFGDLGPTRRPHRLRHPDLPEVRERLRALSDVPNNLPVQHTHFVGRARERRAVHLLLGIYRLVTIVGGGGIGKTRLALQVAASSAERFPDGIWLVELAGARHAAHVAAEIATAIGLEDALEDPLALVAERLGDQRCLILLDNCEFDPAAAAEVAGHLVAACPGLHVLAASRRALESPAEHAFVLTPMAVAEAPSPGAPPSDAARLFLDRARARAPRPAPTASDVALVERLCVLLDGNPLAIELAAARLGPWDLATVYDRIRQRFDALGENPAAQHPRQRSLWATIDWSYQLLGPTARRMFEAFSAFEGGADEAAVQRIGAALLAEDAIPAAVDELTGVFLLERRDDAGSPRWDMLATIRAFATERLEAGGGAVAVRTSHAAWFAEVAVRSTAHINGPEQAATVRRLAREHRNLRSALEWLEARPDPSDGLRMSVALRRYWACAGHFGEGRRHLEALLLRAEGVDARLRADALHSLATLASRQSDFGRARACLEEALAIGEALGDGHLIGKVRNAFGNLALLTGDVATAREHFAAALDRMQELEHEVGIIAALNNLAMAETTLGELATAAEHFETCLALAREIGYARGIADALNNLGMVLGMRSDYRRTRSLLAECVAILQQLGERRRLALAMVNLAHAALRQGRSEDARALCVEALAIQEAVGDRGGGAQTRLGLGMAALHDGDLDEAARELAAALGAMRGLDERHPAEAEAVLGLGEIARRRGESEEAERRLRESLALAEASGDLRLRALALIALGRLAGARGDVADGRARLLEALRLLVRLGGRRGMAEAAEALAALEPAPSAAALLGAAAAERRAIGAPAPPHEASALDALARTLERAPGADAARAAGEARGLSRLVSDLLASAEPDGATPAASVSPR